MNKPLEDLLNLSGLANQSCWCKFDWQDKLALEKFAKLVIQECALMAYDGPNSILKHFEVEQ